jgi:hypothetical protein
VELNEPLLFLKLACLGCFIRVVKNRLIQVLNKANGLEPQKEGLLLESEFSMARLNSLSAMSLSCVYMPANARHWWLLLVILATWKAEIQRVKVQGQPRQTERPHFQNNQSKTDWRCGSRVQHLLCKCEALSSNPRPIQK